MKNKEIKGIYKFGFGMGLIAGSLGSLILPNMLLAPFGTAIGLALIIFWKLGI